MQRWAELQLPEDTEPENEGTAEPDSGSAVPAATATPGTDTAGGQSAEPGPSAGHAYDPEEFFTLDLQAIDLQDLELPETSAPNFEWDDYLQPHYSEPPEGKTMHKHVVKRAERTD